MEGGGKAEARTAPGPEPDGGAAGADPVDRDALGAVLAGGRGSRLGGGKAMVELARRPLISYPLGALAAADLDAIVVAKPSSDLRGRLAAREAGVGSTAPVGPGRGSTARGGALAGVRIVTEPEEPRHPLAGIVAALRHARRPVVVVGCDFPFVPPALLRALADAPEPLLVPAPGGDPQPLVARWTPGLLPRLEAALAREEALRRTVADLEPRLLDEAELATFGDPARAFFNVNTPADLEAAAQLL